jgi:hypothetical protein
MTLPLSKSIKTNFYLSLKLPSIPEHKPYDHEASLGDKENLEIFQGLKPMIPFEAKPEVMAPSLPIGYLYCPAIETFNPPQVFFKIPEDLQSLYDKKIFKLQRRSLVWEHPQMKFIVVPNLHGLMMQSIFYQAKYGIKIFIKGSKEALYKSFQDLLKNPVSTCVGFIVTDPDLDHKGHVTPLVVFKKDEGHLQIVNLDALKMPLSAAKKVYARLVKEGIKIDYISTTGLRLVERHHVRTEALKMLKDTLVFINDQKQADLLACLGAKKHPSLLKYHFELPARMAKTCQTRSMYTSVIQDVCSTKTGLTLAEFKQKYAVDVQRTETFEVFSLTAQKLIFSELFDCETDLRVNLYLHTKAVRYYKKYEEFLSNPNPQFIALFNRMLKTYI